MFYLKLFLNLSILIFLIYLLIFFIKPIDKQKMIWYIKRVKRDSTFELEVATLYTWEMKF